MAENIHTLQVYLTELSRVMYEGTEETQEIQEYANKLGAASWFKLLLPKFIAVVGDNLMKLLKFCCMPCSRQIVKVQ